MEEKGIIQRLTGKGVYPFQMAWLLLLPFRNLYLSPTKLASRLNLKVDSTVLELGCGPGYFSPFIAKSIPKGKLYLADIQPQMLEKARTRLEKKKITNVEFKLCDGNSLPFADMMFDVAYLVTVLGEVANTDLYVRELFRVLKSGGILSVSEQAGDPDSIPLQELETLLLPAGFVSDTIFGKNRTYTANFRKP